MEWEDVVEDIIIGGFKILLIIAVVVFLGWWISSISGSCLSTNIVTNETNQSVTNSSLYDSTSIKSYDELSDEVKKIFEEG